jgi:hypothetical protein
MGIKETFSAASVSTMERMYLNEVYLAKATKGMKTKKMPIALSKFG